MRVVHSADSRRDRRRTPGELPCPGRGLSRRRHLGIQEEASGKGHVREGEGRVGLDRAA